MHGNWSRRQFVIPPAGTDWNRIVKFQAYWAVEVDLMYGEMDNDIFSFRAPT